MSAPSPHEVTVTQAKWPEEIDAIRVIREQVFVDEQQVPPELEWDGLDEQCLHVLARTENLEVVGTGRLQPDGKIGRMAVLKNWRSKSVGGQILEALIELAKTGKHEFVYLYAQKHAIPFYERYHFVSYGDYFPEAGISHRAMKRTLPSPSASINLR